MKKQRGRDDRFDANPANYLKRLRFRRKLIGGVDEADVWRKIRCLDERYGELLKKELTEVQNHGAAAPPAQTGGIQGTDKTKRHGGQALEAGRSPTSEEIRTKRRGLADRREVSSFFIRLAALVLSLFLLFGVFFGLSVMPDGDMMPRLSAGDLMLYYRWRPGLRSQDLVVYEKEGTLHVGRLVARPGDQVEVGTEGGLFVNGSLVLESEIYYTTKPYDNDIDYPVELSEDEYFVLGDYRDGARDSRCYGAVSKNEIEGEILAVLRRSGL